MAWPEDNQTEQGEIDPFHPVSETEWPYITYRCERCGHEWSDLFGIVPNVANDKCPSCKAPMEFIKPIAG